MTRHPAISPARPSPTQATSNDLLGEHFVSRSSRARLALAAPALVVAASLLAGCGALADGRLSSTEVIVNGSSTVAPLAGSAADLMRVQHPDVQVSVAASGTGGGIAKFCAGEIDVATASRHIKDEEIEACKANGIEFVELEVANDAITVILNPENDWAQCLTVEELATIWAPESERVITSWAQVRDGFPDIPLELYGAGTDSGTFDYFTDVINGDEGASRTDYQPTEDDNVTVTGVSGSLGALGYLGFSYYEESADRIKSVAIDNGEGCIEPKLETAQDGSYAPLSRPLFIYVSVAAYRGNPNVRTYVDFFVRNDDAITRRALFVPLSPAQRQVAESTLAALIAGGES